MACDKLQLSEPDLRKIIKDAFIAGATHTTSSLHYFKQIHPDYDEYVESVIQNLSKKST